jgi:Rps23 Pro-64 3,4-dihydroxylase Tpa1-like proline 4-hydroxylase
MTLTRVEIGRKIHARLEQGRDALAEQWNASAPVNHFVLDDLLPQEWTHEIRAAFPPLTQMMLRRDLREVKYVAAQMDRYNPLLEESIYAFQTPEVVQMIHDITGLQALEPDAQLYAGGISAMARGNYLNPHIDNSHDKYRQRYRVINLLFYVSPDWTEADGCNLELWPDGPRGKPVTVVSRCNRLVVMVTHQASWHSVSPNKAAKNRCCVSNYYFSTVPVGGVDYFHVTTFRARPDQPLRDLALRTDGWLRMAIRKTFPGGIRPNPHYYDKTGGSGS